MKVHNRSFSWHKSHSSDPSLPGPWKHWRQSSPQQVSSGHSSRPALRAPRPRCAPRRMRPEPESARPRDGRYKSSGLRTPALPASRGPFPAPGCSDPPGPPHYDRYACVTGFRSVAAPGSSWELGSRGSLQLPGLLSLQPAERLLPPAVSGEGLAGWGPTRGAVGSPGALTSGLPTQGAAGVLRERQAAALLWPPRRAYF